MGRARAPASVDSDPGRPGAVAATTMIAFGSMVASALGLSPSTPTTAAACSTACSVPCSPTQLDRPTSPSRPRRPGRPTTPSNRHRGTPMTSPTSNAPENIVIDRDDSTGRARDRVDSDVLLTWDYTAQPRRRWSSSTRRPRRRSGTASTDLDWSIVVDWEQLGTEERPRSTRFDVCRPHPTRRVEGLGREPVGAVLDREMQKSMMSQFLHGEQGALVVHRADHRDRAVDRRQVLRGDPGDGRGPPRRGVRPLPRGEAPAPTRSTSSSAAFSTTSSPTGAGTSPTSACRSWSRGSRSRPSASCTCSPPSRCSRSCCATS